jgi:DNA-binding response OmpR family regulator
MRLKIALIEDDEILARAMKEELEEGGFDVVHAVDGVQGLQLILQEHPDLVLLDIVMPKMDGLTMLQKLRGDAWGKNVRVLMLTNLDQIEKVAQATDAGVLGYIVKSSHKVEEVVEKVKELLHGKA